MSGTSFNPPDFSTVHGTAPDGARSRTMASSAPAHSLVPNVSSPPPAQAGPARLRLANAALRFLWDNQWATMPSLDPEALIARAAAKADAAPDGDPVGWRARLNVLCDDLERHAHLTDLGRTIAHGQLVSALTARFRAHALWQRYPSIAEQPIAAPIIIVGHMRSGSTRMQRLLACDSRLTFTRFYESWNPIPGDPRVDARKWKGRVGLACARLLNPEFDAIHPTAWNAPDEEIGLQNLSIYGAAFEAQWRVPGYTAAVEQDDGVAVYREFRRLLQTLAWLRNDTQPRPWVLKVPQFAQDLAAMLQVFPDARLIHLRRNAADVVASSASLVCNQMRVQSFAVDPHWIGREWTRKVRLREERIAAARAMATVPQIDVDYEDVTRDWKHEMSRVYRMLGLPLTGALLTRMQRYLHNSHAARRERHIYDPARFGLADHGVER